MNEAEEKKERLYNILVFGIESKGLTAPKDPLRKRNFCLHFKPYNTQSRFNEFDGVILFQGVFEKFHWTSGDWERYLNHAYDGDELDKRKKESSLLLKGGGFLCFLLNERFIDREDGRDFSGSDLAKHYLNYASFYRENFSERFTHLNIKMEEFREFLDLHGAANSYFKNYNRSIEWRVISEADGYVTGMIMHRNQYFIPTLVPDNRPDVIAEYFTLLGDALTSTYNKLCQDLPNWLTKFRFIEEEALGAEVTALEKRLFDISERLDHLRRFKSVLALYGDELVAGVVRVFKEGFGIAVDTTDELREDFTLLDDNSKTSCLCEVKGTNKGVKREYINQADSHRERSGFRHDFPTLLIVNTNIKNARSVVEKDQEIACEQILHAKKMNVLLLRTLDLLELLRLYLNGQITSNDLKILLINNTGWLKVGKDGYAIITGEEITDGT